MQRRLIVTTADRPDLVPTVTGWLWREFWRHDGSTLEQTRDAVAASAAQPGLPHCFVLLADGEPVGTASLTATDLDERPDLTPWLAGVFVVPEACGQGHATRLVAAVEAAGRSASIPKLWLYTNTAEGLYARIGWRSVAAIQRCNRRPVTLMRRDLIPQ